MFSRNESDDSIIKNLIKANFNYKTHISTINWKDREQKPYIPVIPIAILQESEETIAASVEISVSTSAEATAEVTANTNVVTEVDYNYHLKNPYNKTGFANPTLQPKPSSAFINISQLLTSVAGISIDEKAVNYTLVEGDIYDYTSCFEYSKHLTMPEADNYFLIQSHTHDKAKRFYITDQDLNLVNRKKDDINKMISFNRSLYIQCGTTIEELSSLKYLEKKNSYEISRNAETAKLNRSIIYVSKSSDISQFEAPVLPVMTTSALEILKKHKHLYDSGFDLLILPLGFSICLVKSKHKDYNVTANTKGKHLEVKYPSQIKQSYILDWDIETYNEQKARYISNLSDPNSADGYIKALFTADPFEFTVDEHRLDEYRLDEYRHLDIRNLLQSENLSDFEQGGKELLEFFKHYFLLKKYDIDLYNSIRKTLLNEANGYSYLSSLEALTYIQSFLKFAVLRVIEVIPNDSKTISEDMELAPYKVAFAKAVLNSMGKSNFIQISRAFTGFFIKFDEMTSFDDFKSKLKFYKLLVARTIDKEGYLCLRDIEGYAQIELFRLFKILDKAAMQSPKLLELQLELLRDKKVGSNAFQDKSTISIGLYGDAMSYQTMASCSKLSQLGHSKTSFNDDGFVLLDALMYQSKICDNKLEEPVLLSPQRDEDVNILGWLSRKLSSESRLFNISDIENKVAIYKNIREIFLRVEALIKKGAPARLLTSFSTLCKLYVENSLSIESSTFNEVLDWLEGLKLTDTDINIDIPEINIKGIPNIESKKFASVFFDKYVGFDVSVVKLISKSKDCTNPSDTFIFKLYNTLESYTKTTFLKRAKYHKETSCLLIHDKTDEGASKKLIVVDLLRYKKLWNLNEHVKKHILSFSSKPIEDITLKSFFTAMGQKLISSEKYTDKHIDKEAKYDLQRCEDTAIDTRFLSLHALCFEVPCDLTPEQNQAHIIDWINAWVDSCDLRINSSEFKQISYEELQNATTNVMNYRQLVTVMKKLFPSINYIQGAEFSLENILKGPKPVEISMLATPASYINDDLDYTKHYEPLDFLKNLNKLIQRCNLDSQKKDIYYNTIYKLYEYKIFRSQIVRIKNGNIEQIEFRNSEKLIKYAQLICNSYLEDISDISNIHAEDLMKQVTQYTEFALPILEDFPDNHSILKLYKPFQKIYGPYIGEFFDKIKSYVDILSESVFEKFPNEEFRETSADNFYTTLITSNSLWQPTSQTSAKTYFIALHAYLDSILEFGVLSQEFNRHNFTAIIKGALGLLANDDLGIGIQKFTLEDSSCAVAIFDNLKHISSRRSDCLIFEYVAALADLTHKDLFTQLSYQLQHDADALEELIYNIDSRLYDSRFKAFFKIIGGHNLTNTISILNYIIPNLYGPDNELIIENYKDLEEICDNLQNLKDSDFILLKRYLISPASKIYDKSEFKKLFTSNSLNEELCNAHLAGLLKADRYEFDEQKIRDKFSKIEGDFDLDILINDYKSVFNTLSKISTISDERFKEELSLIDKHASSNNFVLIAYIVDGIYRVTGKIMRPIQIAVALLTIERTSNLFHKIQTGQGKTYIICMLASFYGMKGARVDVSTNTFELASRDARKLFPLYTFLGITSGKNAITVKGTQIADYTKAKIHYGTLGEIKLFKNIVLQSGHQLPEGITMLFSDEFAADRDKQTLYRLSRNQEVKGIKNTSMSLRHMLEYMVDFVDSGNIFYHGKKSQDQEEQDKNNFKEYIARKTKSAEEEFIKVRGTPEESIYNVIFTNLDQVYYLVDQMTSKEIEVLLNSCYNSKYLLKKLVKGQRYDEILRYKLIWQNSNKAKIALTKIIVPIVNGKFNRNSLDLKFGQGLQTFLAIRANREENNDFYYYVDLLTRTSAINSSLGILNGREENPDYQKVIGLAATGASKTEKVMMQRDLNMATLSYPTYEEMPKVGLFKSEEYDFLKQTSRARFDEFVLLARSEEEKLDYLSRIMKSTIKNGKISPTLILCNNHEDVYRYQRAFQIIINKDPELKNAIAGIQTIGLGSIKSFENDNLILKDEESYLNLRRKLKVRGEVNINQPLLERIIDQASVAGAITFGTIGNNSIGTDIEKQKINPRELNTIVFGCNTEVLSPSNLIQCFGRTFNRFSGVAGVIVTISEVLAELKKFNQEISPAYLIVQHFYKLLNLIALNNINLIRRDKTFNEVWEIIQNIFHQNIKDMQSAYQITNILANLYQELLLKWNQTPAHLRTPQAFKAEVLTLLYSQSTLQSSLDKKILIRIEESFKTESNGHDFNELLLVEERFLLPLAQGKTKYDIIKPYIRPFVCHTNLPMLLKVTIWITPLCFGKFIFNPTFNTALMPIASNILINILFQDVHLGDKREKLNVWYYEPNIMRASLLAGISIGIGSVVQYQLLQFSAKIAISMIIEQDSISAVISSINIIIVAITSVKAQNWAQKAIIEHIDSKAEEYNSKSEIEALI